MYKIVGGAAVLILLLSLATKGGLDRDDFSLIRERHNRRLNASKDTEYM